MMTKTGHSFIKSEIARTDAVLGGEMSGHIFYNDNWYGFDDAIFASLRLIEILSSYEISTHEVFKKIPKMFSTPEIKISVKDTEKFKIVEELKSNFKPEGYDSILCEVNIIPPNPGSIRFHKRFDFEECGSQFKEAGTLESYDHDVEVQFLCKNLKY